MRKILLVISLLAAPHLFGQAADLRILSATLSNTPTLTGERIALSMRWRNDGPATAHTLHVSVNGTPTPFYILSVATSGWPCYPSVDGMSFLCQNVMMEPGTQADLVLQILTPATPGTFTLRAQVSAEEIDPTPANNVADFSMELAAAPSADISITPNAQTHRSAENESLEIPIFVTNHADIEVRNLFAYFITPVESTVHPFTVEGEGWSCGHLAYGAHASICTRPALAAGEVAPLTLRTIAPANNFTFNARVRGELHSDPLTANDSATATIAVGDPPVAEERWSRILVPLVGPDVPGSKNSLWRIETTGILLSDTPVGLRLSSLREPLRTVFDTKAHPIAGNNYAGTIYVRESDAAKVRLNSRVFDVHRSEQTAGAEIPIVREEEFKSEAMSIVGIPVAPHYRHTLRVYDLDARENAQATIRIFANDETTPRVTTTRAFSRPAYGTPAPLYPGVPGILQLELGQLLPLAGINTIRVDVEPASPSMTLWSFVSVTNNDTHHVTTFSAQ